MSAKKAKRKVGRPPAGLDGQPSSEYLPLAVRVPPATMAQCNALVAALGLPRWKVVTRAIDVFAKQSRRRGRSTPA